MPKIRKWVGIPVSIGVAPTKTLAKIASHFAKMFKGYRGVCMIDTDEKRRKALELTPIGDVWGVGRRNVVKMQDSGVRTAADFVARPEEWVDRHFAVPGVRTWKELQGIVCVAEELPEKRKSICTSRSFAEMIESEDELAVKVADFAAHCARKLREEGTAASNVTTFLRTNRFRNDLAQYCPEVTVTLPVAANSTYEIVSASLRALKMTLSFSRAITSPFSMSFIVSFIVSMSAATLSRPSIFFAILLRHQRTMPPDPKRQATTVPMSVTMSFTASLHH